MPPFPKICEQHTFELSNGTGHAWELRLQIDIQPQDATEIPKGHLVSEMPAKVPCWLFLRDPLFVLDQGAQRENGETSPF